MLLNSKKLIVIYIIVEIIISIYCFLQYGKAPEEFKSICFLAGIGWALYALSNLYIYFFRLLILEFVHKLREAADSSTDDRNSDNINNIVNDFEIKNLK